MNYTIEKDGYTISTSKATLDVNLIHTFISKESYWSKGIPLSIVKKSIECSSSVCQSSKYVQPSAARI